jgi:hypothetical protein
VSSGQHLDEDNIMNPYPHAGPWCVLLMVLVAPLLADDLLVDLNGTATPIAVQSFMPGTQDQASGLATVGPDQRSVTLTGNAWKRLAIPYTVTANTVLEFDFTSTHPAEIHELRVLDADSYYTATINWIHYLGGTQYGAGKYTAFPNTQHFVINLGASFTGTIANLVLTHDNDADDPAANGTYANFRIHEYVPQDLTLDLNGTPTASRITPFMPGAQDLSGTAVIGGGGTAVTLTGNTWKRLPLTYTVTPDTVLEFSFASTHLAEIHELRLLNADTYTTATINWIFDLGGTQYGGGNYTTVGATQPFYVAIGRIFTGPITNLVITNDNDANDPSANGTFSAIRIFEKPLTDLTVERNGRDAILPIQPFMPGSQDLSGPTTISTDGRTATLTGNSWKCVEVDFAITPYTVLEFDFATAHPGEYHEVRLLSGEDYYTSTTNWIYGLCGSQTGIRNYTGGGAVQRYALPIGQSLAGDHARRLVMVNDNDANLPGVTSSYGNFRLRDYVPGLVAHFHDYSWALSSIPDLTGRVPQVARIDAQVNYPSTTSAWTGLPAAMRDTFASRHDGLLRIDTAGSYPLYLNSNDGSRLFLDGVRRINNDGNHSLRERSVTLSLTAGYHPMRIEFHDNTGDAGLIFSWSGPGITKQVVPAEVLFHLGVDQAPIVDAGPDGLQYLPDTDVMLDGGALDLEGAPLTAAWTQVSGPAGVVFSDAAALDTLATFPGEGNYLLRLAVTANGTTVPDTVQVRIAPEPVFGPVVKAFNGGGGAFTAADGTAYLPDTDPTAGRSGGGTRTVTNAIANTVDDPLYQTERNGNFSYRVAVPNGDYHLVLQFAEIRRNAANLRIFDVSAEGVKLLDDFDLFVAAGGRYIAHDRVFPVTVADGVLNLVFTTVVDQAKISAFRLIAPGVNN